MGYVSQQIGYSKKCAAAGMEGEMELSGPLMQMPNRSWYKITGIVTNRELPGGEVARCWLQPIGQAAWVSP